MASPIQNEFPNLDAKCREIIAASHPLFVIHTNHVTTLPTETLFSLSKRVFDAALAALALAPGTVSLRHILTATFDPDHRAFVLDDPSSPSSDTTRRILAVLTPDARACILAQAVAGMVYVLRRVVAAPSRAARELARFAEGPERRRLLAAVERSPVWSDCFEKAQIGDMVMDAVLGADVVEAPEAARGAVNEVVKDKRVPVMEEVTDLGVDYIDEPAFNDGPHVERNMGVPGGFSIMVLN